MPAARYWRLSGITTRGGQTLDLSQLELWSGGAKLTATLSCPVTPLSGSLTNLSDADLGTTASWTLCPGLVFSFDLGSSLSVDVPRFGSVGLSGFPESVMLEYSDDSITWTIRSTYNRVSYPGASALTNVSSYVVIPTSWDSATKGGNCTLSNNNLTAVGQQTGGTAKSLAQVATGKMYWEISSSGARFPIVGIATTTALLTGFVGADVAAWGYYGSDGPVGWFNNNVFHTTGTSAWTGGQVLGFALDADAGTLEIFKAGVSQFTITTGSSGPFLVVTGGDTNSGTSNTTANFGATTFAHTVPSGYSPGFGYTGVVITENPVIANSLVGVGIITNVLPPDFTMTNITSHSMPGLSVGGTSRITGTVKITPATPVARKVRLYREIDGHLMAQTWSNATTGEYSFDNIPSNFVYTVVSYDHLHEYRAVIADNQTSIL